MVLLECADNVIIIPSLDPTKSLIKIVKELQINHLNKILIVDDGTKDQTIFNELESMGIPVIHHEKNLGKGAAIKTGVNSVHYYYQNINAFIFMDSDSQHSIKDVKSLNDSIIKEPVITLGIRNFNKPNIPLRSKIGNKFSSIYFKLITGKTLNDTQTGLRGIPIRYKELINNTPGNRYEFEMNFLTTIAKNNIPFKEIHIDTIYEGNNSVSHFNTLKDSYLIYKEPLKFIISSLTSFIIDIILFTLLNSVINMIFLSNIMARLLSGIYNYNVNKYWCFKSYGNNEFIKYIILFITQMFLSSALIKLFSIFITDLTILKIIIDFILFIISFIIQKRFVFQRGYYEV